MELSGFVVPAGEGAKVWVIDELMTFIATSEDTGGAYALTDSVISPGGGPPLHIHNREDEAFWVLEGELEVTIGDRILLASQAVLLISPEASRIRL
jgi:mannose-6-phosphate isomerase-like protein (cupin superfamily)